MIVWNRAFIRKVLGRKKVTEEEMTEYTKHLIYWLENKAKSNDYYIACNRKPDEMMQRIVEKLGYKYVKTRCQICGREIYALNVNTKAKVICIECSIVLRHVKPLGG